MPIEPVRPRMNMRRLLRQMARAPQPIEQRQQRQAEDGEMIALDALEQMDAERLRADSRRRSPSPRRRPHRDSGRENRRRTPASSAARHRHARTRPRRPPPPPPPNAAYGSCRAAPQAARARRRGRPAWKIAARRAPASGRRRAPCGRDASPPPPWLSRAPAAPRPSPASSSAGARLDRALVDIRRARSRPECRPPPATRAAPRSSRQAPADARRARAASMLSP